MTLISVVINNNYPIVVSDRAISIPDTESSIISPMTNETVRRSTPVHGYCIKTIIIQDRLCVGFSGKVSAIEETIEKLHDFFLHRQVNYEHVKGFVDLQKTQKECSVIYIYADQTDQLFKVWQTGKWLKDALLGSLDVRSAGSGAVDWNLHLMKSAPYFEIDRWHTAFGRQTVLQACMNFVLNERMTAQTLMDGWGGGFDLVYFHDNAFKRLDNLAFAFHGINISRKPHPILMPMSVIHQRYVDGKAIITHFENERTNIYSVAEFNDKTPHKKNSSDCFTSEVISLVHIFDNEKHVKTITVLFWDTDPHAEPALATTKKDGVYVMKYRELYMEKVKQAVDEALS